MADRLRTSAEIDSMLSEFGIDQDAFRKMNADFEALEKEQRDSKESKTKSFLGGSDMRLLEGLLLMFEFLLFEEKKYIGDYKIVIFSEIKRNPSKSALQETIK